jgi:membrane dipeptidase
MCMGRSFAVAIAALGGATVIACSGNSGPIEPDVLHRDAVVVDTHSDTTPFFEDSTWSFIERHAAAENHMDLPRMREGGLDVQFWSIYMGVQEGEGRAVRRAVERMDAVHQLVDANPDDMALATNVAEIRDAVAEGKIANLMGIEGGHIIEDSLPALRTLYRLGARYMTLTHSFHTNWADSAGTRETPEPLHHGLTEFGRDVVREMNRLGMMVDISHVSDDTFWDVLETTSAPVIASHSSCRAVADHVRNMDDAMLRALAQNGGVVMINFYPVYIDETASRAGVAYFERWGEELRALLEPLADDPKARREARIDFFTRHPVPQTSLDVLLDHFDHAIAVAGPAHVGLGADWDGVPSMPVGMEDVTDLPDLTRGLLSRGHSPGTVRGVLGENFLRVMQAVEDRAERSNR